MAARRVKRDGPRKGGGGGSSPGNFQKPVLQMVQSEVFLSYIICEYGLHLSGKGAAVFAEGLSGAVASGLGKVRYLN